MLTQRGFAFWAVIIAAVIILIGVFSGAFEVTKLGNIILGYALAMLAAVAWLEFYMTRRFNSYAKIHENPVALALLTGSVVIAGAIGSTVL